IRGIQLQDFLSILSKLRADFGFIVFFRRLFLPEEPSGTPFIRVPSGEKRDVSLLARGVNSGGVFRKKISVHVGPEAALAVQRGLEDLLRWFRAQFSSVVACIDSANAVPVFPVCDTDSSLGVKLNAPPLSPIACLNKPFERGDAINALTDIDPADSPKIVTLAGSPPNAAIFLRTHSRAAI